MTTTPPPPVRVTIYEPGRPPDHVPAVLDLFVAGRPAPQGSHRHVGGGRLVESSAGVGPWRDLIGWRARALLRGRLIDGPVRVSTAFVMPRPRATPRGATPPAVKRPDVDKLARAVLDALTGVIYADDSQVVDLTASKRIADAGEEPGVRIVVTRLPGAVEARRLSCTRCGQPAARLVLGRCPSCAYPAGGGPQDDEEEGR
jgi:crossover junction endodeoxyribonuclease RusA